MSSAWTERQGQIGSLQFKNKEELFEILRRQEKLLCNKKFVQSLPDKGKRIEEFVERLHLAIARYEETDKNQGMLSAVRTEFQSEYQQALTQRQLCNHDNELGASHRVTEHGRKDSDSVQAWETLPNRDDIKPERLEGALDGPVSIAVGMETTSDTMDVGELGRTKERDLTEALEQVTLSDQGDLSISKPSSSEKVSENPFWGRQTPKNLHYVDVLEKTKTNAMTQKLKFKLNQLAQNMDDSPVGFSLPGRSPGEQSPLSAEARRQRDMKHLDDITAARLPPLHHSPVQLLSLEESVALLREQTTKYEEMQARLAAQKLSERLAIAVGMCSLESQIQGGYREVRHDGDRSSEED